MQTGTHEIEQPAADTQIELELGDGSRLVLEDASDSPIPCRVENHGSRISLEDAMAMVGQPFAGYRHLRN
jgi:hypothetical protein